MSAAWLSSAARADVNISVAVAVAVAIMSGRALFTTQYMYSEN